MDLGAASAASPSLNGYGASHGETDVLILIGAAFVGGLLLGALVTRLAS
jgi:hypothetical protein